MRKIDALNLFYSNNIPLADIKVVFDGYFGCPFDTLMIHSEEMIDDELVNRTINKLNEGYPAVYLAGYIDILKLHIFVTEDVLIPRIETEDFVYSYLKYNHDFNGKRVLDLCTGSGFIAIALKKIFPSSVVVASDISDQALYLAHKSASYNEAEVSFVKSDFLEDIDGTFDFIVSNPPYIEEDSKDVDAPFEPALALFSGKDGLDSYRAIFNRLDLKLNAGGTAFFELESTNARNTEDLFVKYLPNYEHQIMKDLYGRDRFLIVKKRAQ